jgi:hypothetical protein
MSRVVRIMWIPVLLSVLYTGWVFWQRHDSQPPPKRLRAEVTPLAEYGDKVKILQFYTGASRIAAGEKALVCYGVVNAASVRLHPPVELVWPAVSRCFEVAPAKTTRYTLTAEGADHTVVSASIEIAVSQGSRQAPATTPKTEENIR